MTFSQALKASCDELIGAGARVHPDDVVQRAMEINGAADEFMADVERRALVQARREAKHLLAEMDDDSDEEHPQLALFDKLPGRHAPKALALAEHNGDYTYKAFGFCTDNELSEAEKVRVTNVERAQARLDDLITKHDVLRPWFADVDDDTVLDALRRMP